MAGGLRRVLVIEDDLETAGQLVESLATNGYEVDLAVNGDEGLARGCSADYAVMTIDRMLPGLDGIAVIRRLRERGVTTPGAPQASSATSTRSVLSNTASMR